MHRPAFVVPVVKHWLEREIELFPMSIRLKMCIVTKIQHFIKKQQQYNNNNNNNTNNNNVK